MADPVIVAQIGARRRYAVPDALHAAGLLGHFYTDAVCPTPVARMINSIPSGWVPPRIRKAAARTPTHTPAGKISLIRYDKTPTDGSHLVPSQNFAKAVSQKLPDTPFVSYTFNTAGLEIITTTSNRGYKSIHDQTLAPRTLTEDTIAEERKKLPDWEQPLAPQDHIDRIADREREETHACTRVVCGSEFVKSALTKAYGIDPNKVTVIPPCIHPELPERPESSPINMNAPLRVLFAGTLGLRKGI